MTFSHFEPGELHAATFPEPLFIVEPIIPANGAIVMLHGPKTAGKTQLALTLGIAIATGQPFVGQYPCRKSRVLIVEADMPRKMLQARAIQAPGTKALCFLHAEPFDVMTVASSKPLPKAFEEARSAKPDIVIVDSLRKTNFMDENDSTTPTKVYTAWKRLFPGATIAVIHHDKKLPTAPGATYRPEEAARGSGAWLDDADAGLHLTKMRGHKAGGHVSTLTISKCRYMEDPEPLLVRMTPELLLEPIGVSPVAMLLAFVALNPTATTAEAARRLTEAGMCSRATAYRLIEKHASHLSHETETSHMRETTQS